MIVIVNGVIGMLEDVMLLGSADCVSHSRNDRDSVRVTLPDCRLNPSDYKKIQQGLPEFSGFLREFVKK